MKTVVARVVRSMTMPVAFEEVDISTDPDLESRYGVEIPVLLVNGKKAAKYRVTEERLRQILDRRGFGWNGRRRLGLDGRR